MNHFIERAFARVFSKRLRRWRDSLVATGKLFGGPATDDEKLWHSARAEIAPRLTEAAKNRWIKIMTPIVRVRVRRIKPVKISGKTLLITDGATLHREISKSCIESAKRYGEEDGLTISTLEDDFDLLDAFKRNNLTWNDRNAELFIYFSKIKNFYLHFKAWLECVELEKPALLMQQGCLFRSEIPELRFKDVIVLGSPYNPSSGTAGKREAFYPKQTLEDVYCYAITPRGARKLLEAAQKHIVQSVNSFICKRYVDIICCTKQACPVDFLDQLSMPKDIVQPQEEVWESYERPADG